MALFSLPSCVFLLRTIIITRKGEGKEGEGRQVVQYTIARYRATSPTSCWDVSATFTLSGDLFLVASQDPWEEQLEP